MAGFVVVVVEVVVAGAVGTTYLNSDLNQGRARVLIKSNFDFSSRFYCDFNVIKTVNNTVFVFQSELI